MDVQKQPETVEEGSVIAYLKAFAFQFSAYVEKIHLSPSRIQVRPRTT